MVSMRLCRNWRSYKVIVWRCTFLAVSAFTALFLSGQVIRFLLRHDHSSSTTHQMPMGPTFKNISCQKLRQGNVEELRKAEIMDKRRSQSSDAHYHQEFSCSFLQLRHYIQTQLSEEEANFPLAFSFNLENNFHTFERLFRTLYRPHNFYCLHVDSRASSLFYNLIYRFTQCFTNVFLAPERHQREHSQWSALESELVCMRATLHVFKRWKYIFNLDGQEFPLMTNLDIVRILKVMNGSALVEVEPANEERQPKKTPLGITWVKGSPQVALPRKFVEFMLMDSRAELIRNQLKKEASDKHPWEMFFATLAHNPKVGAPGAYKGKPESDFPVTVEPKQTPRDMYPVIHRLENWFQRYSCASHMEENGLCVWSLKDMPYLMSAKRPEMMVANIKTSTSLVDCLEERLWRRTAAQYHLLSGEEMQQVKRDGEQGPSLEFYQNLKVVRNHN